MKVKIFTQTRPISCVFEREDVSQWVSYLALNRCVAALLDQPDCDGCGAGASKIRQVRHVPCTPFNGDATGQFILIRSD